MDKYIVVELYNSNISTHKIQCTSIIFIFDFHCTIVLLSISIVMIHLVPVVLALRHCHPFIFLHALIMWLLDLLLATHWWAVVRTLSRTRRLLYLLLL